MRRWAFLGAGAMAGAMVRGLLSRGAAKPSHVVCIGGNDPTATNLARDTGIGVATTFEQLLDRADVLILACKPQNLADLPPTLATLTAGKVIISIVAGKRLATLTKLFPEARIVVRVMPNTPAQIGAGVSGWCPATPLAAADRDTLLTLLQAMGRVVEVDETMMDALTAVSGSGPAYVFEFAAALREAGVAAGLPLETARILAQQSSPSRASISTQSS
jgi:pyrroline-5-carboxylate reductase